MTKEKFESFVKVQASGICNMLDSRIVCEVGNLTKDEHLDIIINYAKYEKEYDVHFKDYVDLED